MRGWYWSCCRKEKESWKSGVVPTEVRMDWERERDTPQIGADTGVRV